MSTKGGLMKLSILIVLAASFATPFAMADCDSKPTAARPTPCGPLTSHPQPRRFEEPYGSTTREIQPAPEHRELDEYSSEQRRLIDKYKRSNDRTDRVDDKRSDDEEEPEQ